MKHLAVFAAALLAGWALPAAADSTEARCDIYPAGSDRADKMIPCIFSQRQGQVTIRRSDDVVHELSPVGDASGNFRDRKGRAVYRQSGLGDQGLIFRFPDESLYLYWSTAALNPDDAENPTAPFSTKDYDATTLLRCRAAGEAAFASCPAGILRMEDRQASIVVQGPAGDIFTINFLKDDINATNRTLEARLEGDTWIVTIDGKDLYEVPLAAIEGG